ncbi:MAG: iron-sulfur cluster assembly accessory protein [Pseudomonadota bacterium]
MELTLTPAAEKFVRRMINFGGAGANAGFRLTVSAGGCSGLASEFTVEPVPLAGDAVVEVAGVRFFLPAESRLLLQGATIDFADTPTHSGLTFVTPNSPSCGCSSSSSSGVASIDISSIGHRH